MQIWKAREVASGVVRVLGEWCERMEVVGSIRRGEKKVKDIDIIALVKVEEWEVQSAFFGISGKKERRDPLRDQLVVYPDTFPPGWEVDAVGPKLIKLVVDGVKVEVWTMYDVREWGISKVIRTGPAEFSKALVTMAKYKHWHVKDLVLHLHEMTGRPGARVPCDRGLACKLLADTRTEAGLFTALGLPFMEPEYRSTPALSEVGKKLMEGKYGS